MPAGFRALVPPIVGEPSPHGLLGGCVEVVTTTDMHELNGTDMLSLSCADSNLWYQCDATPGSPTPDNPSAKVFDHPKVCNFDPVTVYSGVECSTFGLSFQEFQDRALEGLRMGEQRALEEHVMREVLCPLAAGNDLTPAAGALHIAQGIGVLETWLALNYGGAGVIHAPIGTAALLSMNSLIDFSTEEMCPRTLAGNSVILGGGYSINVGPVTPGPGCAVAPAGEAWLYITPPMRIRRDERMLVDATGQGVNIRTNDRRTLAETTFVPEISCCIAAAVRVSLTACP